MTRRPLTSATEPAELDALLLVARHLRKHPGLPEPHKLSVDRHAQRVDVQLPGLPDQELIGLLAWADSLTDVAIDLWHNPGSPGLLVTVLGRTSDDVPVKVFDSVPYPDHPFPLSIESEVAYPIDRSTLVAAAERAKHPGGDLR